MEVKTLYHNNCDFTLYRTTDNLRIVFYSNDVQYIVKIIDTFKELSINDIWSNFDTYKIMIQDMRLYLGKNSLFTNVPCDKASVAKSWKTMHTYMECDNSTVLEDYILFKTNMEAKYLRLHITIKALNDSSYIHDPVFALMTDKICYKICEGFTDIIVFGTSFFKIFSKIATIRLVTITIIAYN